MKSIIERVATYENNSYMEVKVTQKKSSRAFVKETQLSKTCSTVKFTWQAKHPGGASPRSKCSCVRYVCPILNLWIIISSRQGKLNMLITLAYFDISNHQSDLSCQAVCCRVYTCLINTGLTLHSILSLISFYQFSTKPFSFSFDNKG